MQDEFKGTKSHLLVFTRVPITELKKTPIKQCLIVQSVSSHVSINEVG